MQKRSKPVVVLAGRPNVGKSTLFNRITSSRRAIVTDVPGSEPRGHAQRSSHRFLLCLRGSCVVVVDDGQRRAEVVLDAPQRGLHLPPLTWSQRAVLGADALLMVFESQPGDEPDEIRDHDAFLAAVAERTTYLPGILPSTPLT